MNNNQRWVNYSGEYITQGSDFVSQPQSADLLILDTHQYNGKTYAHVFAYMENEYGNGPTQIGNVDRVSGIAQALGGVSVPSDEEELASVQSGWNNLEKTL